ncbi:alpha carbonic anhydrase [Nitzschia inconspicua]|uniref:Alpha carbonic anhydrase n=1 Tax=Nitzschia inconspicua TaxID=303405 RepID=A0A9K3Q683_9STRA|nr:alpha carbonic anhydrase [Nitzschia inconspicua]
MKKKIATVTPTPTSPKRRWNTTKLVGLVVSCSLFMAFEWAVDHVQAQNSEDKGYLDRFTYQDETIDRGDGFFDYRPEDWDKIKCNENSKLDECEGYNYKWREGINWTITDNFCKWCPDDGSKQCGRHHQSPINLLREFGLEPGTHENAEECIDLHWMKYEDSFCSLEELIDSDAFTIERHGLRIQQPITVFDDYADDNDGVVDGVRLNCRIPGNGSRFGRIDFSKGFSDWWYLSHIDLHVPSEHHQEGKQYSGEIQLYHFYSKDYDNEMATVSVFLEAYEDAVPYKFLDKVICQWRRKEYNTRLQCGMDPVDSTYPGCFPLFRDRKLQNKGRQFGNVRGRNVEDETDDALWDDDDDTIEYVRIPHNYKKPFKTVADIFYFNAVTGRNSTLDLEDVNYDPAEKKDWAAWIAEQSKKMKQEEELYHKLKNNDYGGEHSDEMHEHYRKLIMGDEMEWFNYWPLIGVRTEYYYRYQGAATIPPCYGNDTQGSRRGTNHWRVLKDPIRIHPRQLEELERLIRERIAPPDDVVNPCQPDTAAKVSPEGRVNTARPLMYHSPESHFKTFCECKDWESKWPEDRAWCLMTDINQRFYEKPYNFESDGW